MIVSSMSNLERWKALVADSDKLQIKADILKPKFAKEFRKGHKFPAWKWAEYEHQLSRNKYLIGFYAPSQQYAEHPQVKVLAFLQEGKQKIVIEWGYWQYRKFGSLYVNPVPYIGYYSSHFFSRYRERIWHDNPMSYNELLCRYFFRNQLTIPIELNEDIQRKYQDYGECAAYAFQRHDGTCFIRQWSEGDELSIGKEDSDRIAVTLYYTFVNNCMMTDTQNQAIGKEGKKYIYEYYRKLFRDALNEAFIRQESLKSENYIEID